MTEHPTRRTVLAAGATGTGLALIGMAARPAHADAGAFRHGVASGDPLPGSVVIWTRVTPTAAALPGSGAGPDVTVDWEVARDERFRRLVRSGRFATGAHRDHTVKVDVTGLQPATWYFYRFRLRGETSPVGRTRTAPDPLATPANLRFGVVSCSNLQAGWFSAYRHLARREDLHAVLHLGDYLYEYAPGQYGMGADNVDVRSHVPAREMVSLADYRQRHGQYKTDPDLQELHARYPWIVTWDDHEVTNDAWSDGAENHQPDEGSYVDRRGHAHRAYDEWMPVRMSGTASVGDGTRLYRRLRFGTLAELSMLDLRTYRSRQAAQTSWEEVRDPARTITGDAQMAWLKESLLQEVQWKLVGNPLMIAPVSFASLPRHLVGAVNDVTGLLPEDGIPYNVDQWDGYTADRRELLSHIRDHAVKDAVFLTGDIHSAWACELPYDASVPELSDSAGVELVCTSVTSNNLKDILAAPPRTASLAVESGILASNRHVKYLDFDSHGYSVLDVTSTRAQMDWYVISSRADRDATVRWSRSMATPTGTGRVQQVFSPVGGS